MLHSLKKKSIRWWALSVLAVSSVLPVAANAQNCGTLANPGSTDNNVLDAFRRVACSAGFFSNGNDADVTPTSLVTYIGLVLNVVLGFTGIVFVVLMVYGGFLWMTARGNEDQVHDAEHLIRNSVIGIIVVFSAFSISRFVISGIAVSVGHQ